MKDDFHSLQLSENSKGYCGILPDFGSASYLYQRMPMGLNISPSIWKSYINAILDYLQNRKYCEGIMGDLSLFTPSKKSHMDKLEDLLKALLTERFLQRSVNCLEPIYNTWAMKYLYKTKEYVCNTLRSMLEAIQRLQPPPW